MTETRRTMWFFLGMLFALFLGLAGGTSVIAVVAALIGLVWLVSEGLDDDAMQLDPAHLQRFDGVGQGDSPRDW